MIAFRGAVPELPDAFSLRRTARVQILSLASLVAGATSHTGQNVERVTNDVCWEVPHSALDEGSRCQRPTNGWRRQIHLHVRYSDATGVDHWRCLHKIIQTKDGVLHSPTCEVAADTRKPANDNCFRPSSCQILNRHLPGSSRKLDVAMNLVTFLNLTKYHWTEVVKSIRPKCLPYQLSIKADAQI